MFNLYKNIFSYLGGAAFICMVALANNYAYADMDDTDGLVMFSPANPDMVLPGEQDEILSEPTEGTWVLHGNCDPDAGVEEDENDDLEDWQKSCNSQGITMEEFEVTIRYQALAGQESYDYNVGIAKVLEAGPYVKFRTYLVGDKVCVYATLLDTVDSPTTSYGVAVYGSRVVEENKDENYNIIIGPDTNGLTNSVDPSIAWHCLPVPPPIEYEYDIDWGGFISPVCTNYDSSSSNFRDESGANRAFTGIVVECIEDTMLSIFTVTDEDGETFFTKLQSNLITILRALLALYIVFIGYQFLIDPKGKIKQEDWHWYVLKFALVIYFAVGPGMPRVLPMLQSFTKGMSTIVMESTFGNAELSQAAYDQLEIDYSNYAEANEKLVDARQILSLNLDDPSAQEDVKDALAVSNQMLEEYNNTKADADSFGYRFCDFSDFSYPEGKEYMRLWDMIDCKVTKYLGVGDNIQARDQPQVLIIAMAMIASHAAGLLIFALAVVLLIYILLVIVRIVHIYIMASISLILLVYISPLIIPAVLFKFTKSIFDTWVKQIISYMFQPIIMFGFLAFLFAAFDMATYGGNHYFIPTTEAHSADENRLCMTWIDSELPSKDALCSPGELLDVDISELRCDDSSAPGCIYQKMTIVSETIGMGLSAYETGAVGEEGVNILIGLLKMLIIGFLGYAVLNMIEDISRTMTNAISDASATKLSTVPTPDLQAIHNATTGKLFDGVIKLGGLASKAIKNKIDKKTNKEPSENATKRGGALLKSANERIEGDTKK